MPGPKKDSDFSRGPLREQNGNRQGFRTDTAISNPHGIQERTLQRWQPDGNSVMDGGLESGGNSGRAWDQFATNERLFGVTTDYDENIYTTEINRNHPQYNDRRAFAERAAREIEKSAPLTTHQAEERIMDFIGADKGNDEEEKYSGVRRTATDFPPLSFTPNTGKYTPPAKRAPANQQPSTGVSYDPAIISSVRSSNSSSKRPLAGNRPTQSPIPKPTEAKANTKPESSMANTAKANSGVKAFVNKTTTNEAGQEVLNQLKGLNKDNKPSEPAKPEAPSTPAAPKAGPAAKALATPMTAGTIPKAGNDVGQEVYHKFKNFAQIERANAEKARSTKLRQDKEEKLHELRKFATTFKLHTPVPTDLIGIIAKDPQKQQEIAKKALRNAAEVKKSTEKDDKTSTSKDTATSPSTPTKPATSTGNSALAPAADSKNSGFVKNTVPAGSGQASSNMNRYSTRPQFTTYHSGFRNDRNMQSSSHSRTSLPIQSKTPKTHNSFVPPPGSGAQSTIPFPAPIGPGSNPPPPPSVTRPAPSSAPKMNAAAPVFRPDAPTFNPAGLSKPTPMASVVAPSPRPVSGVAEPAVPATSITPAVVPTPAANAPVAPTSTLIRRKNAKIDPKKYDVYAYLKNLVPKTGKDVAQNGGIVYAFDTPVLWRTSKPDEKDDSTMKLTIKTRFEKMPFVPPGAATPAHAPALPLHAPMQMVPGMGPRQSPHMPAMQMQPHGGMPHHVYDDRMIHSQSQQSYPSPRMSHMQPYLNSPQMHAMTYGGPPGPQFRGGYPGGQYMPQQGHMGGPMMPPSMFTGPHGGHSIYPHVPFMPSGGPGVNSGGFSSPGRPQAPMIAPQGSQQGQPGFGMSPSMNYNSPVFVPAQQGPGNGRGGFGGPGMQHYGSSPQHMHQYGPGGHHMGHRTGSHNSYKSYQNHNNGPGHNGPSQPHSQQQTPTPPTRTENATPNTEEAK